MPAGRPVDGFHMEEFLGRDVHGATLGLVGYGRIGRAVARRAEGFDMEVIHHTRTPTGEPGWIGDLHELLGRADIVSLHVPLNPGTRHLIGRAELAAMKPTAVLVNTARGPVVDEEALAEALEQGVISAAGIDVYEREPAVHPRLLAAPGAVLLPHIGSATVATRTAMSRLASRLGPGGAGRRDAAQRPQPRGGRFVPLAGLNRRDPRVHLPSPRPGDTPDRRRIPMGLVLAAACCWPCSSAASDCSSRASSGLLIIALVLFIAGALTGARPTAAAAQHSKLQLEVESVSPSRP